MLVVDVAFYFFFLKLRNDNFSTTETNWQTGEGNPRRPRAVMQSEQDCPWVSVDGEDIDVFNKMRSDITVNKEAGRWGVELGGYNRVSFSKRDSSGSSNSSSNNFITTKQDVMLEGIDWIIHYILLHKTKTHRQLDKCCVSGLRRVVGYRNWRWKEAI